MSLSIYFTYAPPPPPLQITMLDVMEKYGPMEKLEHLRLRNLSMGSLLIILPFAPNLRTLSLRYNAARGATAAIDDSAAPNLTDDLFQKIFKRNQGRIHGLRKLYRIIFNIQIMAHEQKGNE